MKPHRSWAATALFVIALGLSSAANATSISGQGTWETTLQGRDLDGNLATAEAYYDTMLNITWMKSTANGGGDWATVNVWAAGLNPYGSNITGWRLPDTNPVNGTTLNFTNAYDGSADLGVNISAPGTIYAGSTGSEMAHMYYNTLGNKSYCDPATSTVSSCSGPQPNWGLTNTGPFSNVMPIGYWSATEATPSTSYAYVFGFSSGLQTTGNETIGYGAWAVHSGDVGVAVATSTVPVPATVWLFGSGLTGLFGVAQNMRRGRKLSPP